MTLFVFHKLLDIGACTLQLSGCEAVAGGIVAGGILENVDRDFTPHQGLV